ncbi:MAG: Hsp20/alpha crystallin family protein [Hyphomicrobiales bacterium]
MKSSNNSYPSFPALFDKLFDGNLMDFSGSGFFNRSEATIPAVNMHENENEYQIEVAAPGLKKENFKIDYNNGYLTISSEKENKVEEKEGHKMTRCEFSYQSFKRSFTAPQQLVDTDKIKATYKEGILNVILPKREEAKPKPNRLIEIK